MLRNTTLLVALAIFTAAFANAQQPAPTLAATPLMGDANKKDCSFGCN